MSSVFEPTTKDLLSFKRNQTLSPSQRSFVRSKIDAMSPADVTAALSPYLTISDAATTYVPRTGGAYSGNVTIPALFLGAVDGPRLDRSGGTIRARSNDGLSDAAFSAATLHLSGVNGLQLGSNARSILRPLSTDVTGASGVELVDSFGTGPLPLRVGNVTTSGNIVFAASPSSSGEIQRNGSVNNQGIVLRETSTGAAVVVSPNRFDVFATSGLRVFNNVGSADGSVSCGNVTASGNVIAGSGSNFPVTLGQNLTIGGFVNFALPGGSHGFCAPNVDQIRPTKNGAVSDNTLILGTVSHRLAQVHTVALNCTNLTANGIVSANNSVDFLGPTVGQNSWYRIRSEDNASTGRLVIESINNAGNMTLDRTGNVVVSNSVTIPSNGTGTNNGLTLNSFGGAHSITTASNVLVLNSYNRTELRNNGTTVLDTNGGMSAIANAVPGFPRGLFITPLALQFQGLVVRGLASQTANLTEWQNSAGTVLASVGATGNVTATNLRVNNGNSNANTSGLTLFNANGTNGRVGQWLMGWPGNFDNAMIGMQNGTTFAYIDDTAVNFTRTVSFVGAERDITHANNGGNLIRFSTVDNSTRVSGASLVRLQIGALDRFVVTDTQLIVGSNPSIHSSIFGFQSTSHTAPIAGGRGVTIFGRNNVTDAAHVGIGGEAFTATSAGNILLLIGNTFTPASGTATYHTVRVTPTINQTGGANGITRGIGIEPTLTSAADWRSFDTNVNSGFAYHSSGTAPSRFAGNVMIGSSSITPVARIQVRGSGNTNSTFSLRVEDSDGSNWLTARDDRMLNVSGTLAINNGATITPSAGSDSVATTQFCGLRFRSVLNLSDPLSEFFFRNSNGSRSFTSSTGALMEFSGSFAPTSGTGAYAIARLTGTINQTGGANGITQGILVAPTLTAAADWRSFDTNVNSGFAYHSSGSAPSRFGGNVGIGTVPTARFQVEASDNSTQGIFVRNSNDGTAASTDLTLSNLSGQVVSLRNHSSTHSVWANTSVLSSSQSGGLAINTSTTGPIVLFVSNSERVRATTLGLQVTGTMSATGNITTTGLFRIANDIGMQRVSAGIMLLLADSELRIQNSAATTWTPIRCGAITSAFQTLAGPPSTIDIPDGFHRVVKDNSTSEIRDWVNDGGVMKKSPAYT